MSFANPGGGRRHTASTCLVLCLLLAAPTFAQNEQALGEIKADGLVSLQAENQQWLVREVPDDGLRLRAVTLQKLDGTAQPFDVRTMKRSVVEKSTILKADWGTIATTFEWKNDALNIKTRVENTGNFIIRGVDLQLLTLRFPAMPTGFNGDPRLNANHDEPGLINADGANWKLFLSNDDPTRAMIWGFPYSLDKPDNRIYPLILSTQQIGWLQGPNLLDPYLARPIYPGGSDTFSITLHFNNQDRAQVLADYAQAFPMQLKWDDRRPIGMIAMSASEAQLHSPTNPRGWFNDPKLDVRSADFQQRVLERARESVRILKSINAQGAIVWDIEGQQYPHATSYLGDPRSLPGEIDAIADEFFQIFRAAGLKIGVTIRPQRPMRSAYGEAVEQIAMADAAQTLIDKIAYAKKRWGCTLFYIDSNGDPNVPFPAQIFEQVLAAQPDVLLMPEHQSARYYRVGAPYDELRAGVTGTPDKVRAIYPRAFSVISVADGDAKKHHDELVSSVKRGDILMSRVWFDDPDNAEIKAIYDAAK